MHDAIPALPGDITPGWLTSALRDAGAVSTATVTRCQTTTIGQEWGFTGIVSRVELEYDHWESGAPASIVAKFPNAAGETLSAFRQNQQRDPALVQRYLHRCAREIWFYQQVAPRSRLPAPAMYHGVADLDGGRFVLLLEDLGGMRSGDALAGCSVTEAGSVLDAIAPLHAGWWSQDQMEHLAWIPRWPEDPAGRVALYRKTAGPFLERYQDRISDPARRIVERLGDPLPGVLEQLAGAPRTIGHADLHLDNVLFDASGAATIIDWQTVLWIPAACDLAAFIVEALDPNTRRQQEARLLRRYHDTLLEHGVRDYALDDLRHHYQLALLNVLVGIVYWLGSANPDALAGREHALLDAAIANGRVFSAVEDHQLDDLLPD